MDFPNPKELAQTVGKAAGTAISEGAELVDKVLPGDSELVGKAVKPIVDLLDSEEADGDDGGSSNWAAWGHPEIREMLDSSVTPEDIHAGAQAWNGKGTQAADIVTGLISDLNGIVTGGWRGDSAKAAVGSLGPITDWSSRLGEAVERTNRLMDMSGDAAGQAKATVPPPLSHDWGGTLRSFGSGGPVGAFRDAVAQDDAQAEAHAQAVQIMNSVYSAPINENRAAVPAYPALTDPTLQPPETPPGGGRVPGTGGPGPRMAVGGSPAGGGGGGPAGDGGGYTPYEPSNGGGAGGPGGGVPVGTGGQVAPFQPGAGQPVGGQGAGGGGQQTGGQGGGAAGGGGVPVMPPAAMGGGAVGGAGAGGSRAGGAGGGRFGGAGGGRVGGAGGRFGGGGAAGGQAGFGPRGSGGAAGGGAGQGMAGRGGGAPFGAGGAGARGGMGGGMGAGMMGAGAGRGRGGEDTEHERPSYLIEMDDVFNDGRKVAPPVIGEDPPESDR